jgi:hypothetical protein
MDVWSSRSWGDAMSTPTVSETPTPRDVGVEMQRGAKIVALSLLGTAAIVSVLLVFAADKPGGGKDIGAGITLFVLFAAAGGVGAILGFLFGLPRERLSDQLSVPTLNVTAAPGQASTSLASAHYLASSNLNKVSDWLTTIVIGLGLVNLGNALPALRLLAAALQAPLGGGPYTGALGIATMIVALIGGFLVLYLFTTIRVRQLLEETERQSDDVPPLQDLSLGEAQRLMSHKKLFLDVDSRADPRRLVTGQAPPPGSTVPAGSPVKVELGPPVAADVQTGADPVHTPPTAGANGTTPAPDAAQRATPSPS